MRGIYNVKLAHLDIIVPNHIYFHKCKNNFRHNVFFVKGNSGGPAIIYEDGKSVL